ncbi:MAG: hypothetical protein ONB48_00500 [candidate division KSB1 bacterium]|nr:hypothetical protein [candidate division KSB1 bacterium]MDZ7272844.1 hypothetical protein [candidate division KSB1 bacterium]MDZ7284133.1 hypothetical protein [candidate division KSB1 bacterium]MDZ7297469.1 hypothetical protein [candidate division KSB1 bacterium]MDZ7305605.1 hypothetical protein [candidate division KSB1 bacterium]
MKRQFLRVSSAMLLLAAAVSAQKSGWTPQPLHPVLGEVIDANENSRYRIFGEIAGFTAARYYHHSIDWQQLHLLRNHDGRGQHLVLRLTVAEINQIRNGLAQRVQALAAGDTIPARPLYAIAESRWPAPAELTKITLRDGTVINCRLLAAQNDTLLVQTPGGLHIAVPDLQIVSLGSLAGVMRDAEFQRSDPNHARLLLAPTGRGLPAGQGYFADYYLFFPTLAYGVTDFLSVSGGISILPGASSQLGYAGFKLTWPASSQVELAAGLTHLMMPEDVRDATLAYSVATFGSSRSAVTLGAGLPFTRDEIAEPVLLLGAETQLSNSMKLLTENWIFTGTDEPRVLFSGGVRFFGERLAVDLALFSSEEFFEEDIGFPFVPWVDFSVFFGK